MSTPGRSSLLLCDLFRVSAVLRLPRNSSFIDPTLTPTRPLFLSLSPMRLPHDLSLSLLADMWKARTQAQQNAKIALLEQRLMENTGLGQQNAANFALLERRVTDLTVENTNLRQELTTKTPAILGQEAIRCVCWGPSPTSQHTHSLAVWRTECIPAFETTHTIRVFLVLIFWSVGLRLE